MRTHKINAITLTIFSLILFLSIFNTAAFAAITCVSGEVIAVGVNPLSSVSKYEVFLTCDDTSMWDGARKYFIPTETLGDAGLATFLTAKSTGKKVFVRLASSQWSSLVEQVRILDTNTD